MSWKILCRVGFISFLSGCTTDLVTPPYEDHPNMKVAEMARSRGDIPQAVHDYRDIIKECPSCEKAYIGLGMSLLDGNSTVEAKNVFDKAIALFPKSAAAHTGLGLVYLVMDQPENAIKMFDCALKINPRDVKALNGYGIALDLMGDYDAAQIHYRAAMELDPLNVSYESNLALSMALTGNTMEAIRILERLASLPNATPRVRQNLALAYALAGNTKLAKKIGRIDLSDSMVMNNISYIEAIQRTQEFSGMIAKDHTVPLDQFRKVQGRYY